MEYVFFLPMPFLLVISLDIPLSLSDIYTAFVIFGQAVSPYKQWG